MPIPLPNLDDRTYDELAAEARALIPSLHPAWTNHNPSDPGIVLVELLAWLTEMLLYQVNEVPDASTEAFLTLLNGPGWSRPDGTSLDDAVLQTVRRLRERYRAVTVDDYEHLALHAWPRSAEARGMPGRAALARVRCVPQRDLAAADPSARQAPAPGHVSLVVLSGPAGGETHPRPAPELCTALADYLAPRRMLATRLHVVGPAYREVTLAATLALREDAVPSGALAEARRALEAFFDPLTGGPDGTGWPFGRDVHVSEVYALLEHVAPVDHVDQVIAGPHSTTGADGRPTGVTLDDHELVRLAGVELVAYDVHGQRHTSSTGEVPR
jgi:hypothetical protein